MATNPYLQWFTSNTEQALYRNLFTEQIRNHAHDVYYLPRTGVNYDDVLQEFQIVKFETALPVEVYFKNFDSFEGDGQLLSKFGLEIRDQMTLVMSLDSFETFIKPTTAKNRPLEGDCIYIPMLENVYQIKYVNTSAVFYAMGKNHSVELVCELLEYNNEQFTTGVSAIDSKYLPFQNVANNSYDLSSYDNAAGNEPLQVAADAVLDFSELDPFEAGEY